jgi:ribosomal protein L31
MKPGIHPDYRHVVFEDSSGGQRWICRSTIIDTAGRVERFNKRYGRRGRG